MTSPAKKRRILIVAHNFPPLASGGVHRPVKFARYLRVLGWEVEVLSVKNIRYHAYDASLLEELPDVTVHRAGSAEILRWAWLAGWRPATSDAPADFGELESRAPGRGYRPVSRGSRWFKAVTRRLAVPDNEVGWVPFAAVKGLALLEARRFDAVLTTSPPESCHLVGWALKRLAGATWVADFRDAWTSHHLRRDLLPVARFANRWLERGVLRAADGVVANSAAMARTLKPRLASRVKLLTLPNGFDAADFGPPLAKVARGDFVAVHNGSFRGGRRALALLEGFAEARRRDADFGRAAKLYLLGISRGDDLAAAERLGLEGAVFAAGYIRHGDALRACRGADLLVLAMTALEGAALVPGKVYEYVAMNKPILAAIPPGEARDVLRRAAPGAVVVGADNAAAIAEGFLSSFDAWRRGEPRAAADAAAVAEYARPAQVARLAAFLEAVA